MILGLSAGFHDAGATLTSNQGKVLFAGHAERYSGIKNDANLNDELIEDIKTNCEDVMIRTFIGNVQKSIVIDEDDSEPVVVDTDKNESDENECQICFQPGGIPISTDEGDGYCKHTFHPRCLAQWALSTNCSNHNCCPTCRKPFG